MNEIKNCPFCAEEIKPDAIKCKHCGEWLQDQSIESKTIQQTKEPDKKDNWMRCPRCNSAKTKYMGKKSGIVIGSILLSIFLLGAGFVFPPLWIGIPVILYLGFTMKSHECKECKNKWNAKRIKKSKKREKLLLEKNR
jgi:hypothetical protein